MWMLTLLVVVAFLLAACRGSSASPAAEATRQAASDEHMDVDEHMDAETTMDGDEHIDEDEHMDADEHADAGEPMDSDGMMDMEHEHVEPPTEYEGLMNPYRGDPDAIAEGAALFAAACATCHGEAGMGDGPAAAGLDPQPATLADHEMMETMSDGYLFWRVNEGGAMEPFNSAMPSWKAVYSEDQLWKILAFVRTLAE